jgi:hypothetical protein
MQISSNININLLAGADFGEIALVVARWRNNYFLVRLEQ